jgi:hypothetical protein
VIAAAASLDGRGSLDLYAASLTRRFRCPPPGPEKTGEYTRKSATRSSSSPPPTCGSHHLDLPVAPVLPPASTQWPKLALGTRSGIVLVVDVASGGLELAFAAARR